MSTAPTKSAPRGGALVALALTALGVVYGDIGTSPLYALKECFAGLHSIPPTQENVLGVMSLVFWAINFVVSFKYVTFVLRADNRGEGGILALLALVRPISRARGARAVLVALGLFGAALLYGDGVITPAISVLGAVEGISVATPAFHRFVWPISVAILTLLFVVQRNGTDRVGRVFGPVMVVWFSCIALLGIKGIMLHPSVLQAMNPIHAINLFARDGVQGFLVLGSVVLVLTGAEALYADMGHFGPRPIRLTWFTVVLPCLLLNYFGQSALLLERPVAAVNPFYSLVPSWGLYPMVVVATAAAIVASQALISGAFSLTRQAVQLGYSPRVTIIHTSKTEMGQIYIPEVNQALWLGCLALVIGFRSSTNLAAAYGIAVTGTMIITTLLFHTVARDRWNWPAPRAWALTRLFLAVDLAFFAANLVKIREGGWFPLVVAVGIYTLMTHLEPRPGPARGHRAREHAADGPVPGGRRPSQAAPGAGHGGLPHVRLDRRPAGAAAPSQAQQGAAREGDADVGRHGGDPAGGHRGAGGLPGAGGGVLPGDRALRLHGDPRRAGGPRGTRPRQHEWQAGLREGDGDDVLSGPGDADCHACRPEGRRGRRRHGPRPHVQLAKEALHSDDAERPLRDGVLRPAAEPSSGAGSADTILGER